MFLLFRYVLYTTIQWLPLSVALLALLSAGWVAHRFLRCPNCASLSSLSKLTLMDNGKRTICPNCTHEIFYETSSNLKK
jgi:uncharacterized paraquat-inducible protein A